MKYLCSNTALLTLITALFFILPQKAVAQVPPVIWQHCYGGDSTDIINCVKQTADGGFIATGYTRSVNGDLAGNDGVRGLWVLKLDAAGNIQWEKTYSDTLYGARYIEPTSDGGYILTGYQTIKLHSDGSIEWLDNIDGNTIHQTTDGGYILCESGITATILAKLHSDGSLYWQYNYNSTGIVDLADVCESYTSGYIITGNDIPVSHPTPFLGKTDNSGNLALPVSDIGGHMSAGPFCKNNGTYLYTINYLTGGFAVVEFDDNLDRIWSVGPFTMGWASGITATNDGGFATWVGSGISSVIDMTLLKFDASHNQVWTKSFPGTQSDQLANVLQIANGNYVVAASIAPGDTLTPGGHGGYDGWVAMLGYNTSVPTVKTSAADIKVYPVPATSQLFIDLPSGYQNATLRLMDVSGNTLVEENSNTLNRTLDLTHFAAGQYLLSVINNGSFNSYKVIHY